MSGTLTVPPSKHRQVFLQNVSSDILAAILRHILQSYRDSSDYCYTRVRKPLAKSLSGHYRQHIIDDGMFGIADRYKGHLFAEDIPYKRNTGSHVQLLAGMIRMTQSCVTNISELPRDAEFRQTLAGTGQQGLWPEYDDTIACTVEENNHLYAIILHGVDPTAEKREKCAFICVRFPHKDCKNYYSSRIDLFKLFPQIVEEFYPKHQTDEGQPVRIVAKKKKKAAGQ